MAESAFRYLRFKPRLVSALRGYSRDDFIADLGSGITVAIIALPLAMAFGIASGVRPEQGIVTAIIAGLLISALGGSRVQIGGPAGAFVALLYSIAEKYGVANLLIATKQDFEKGNRRAFLGLSLHAQRQVTGHWAWRGGSGRNVACRCPRRSSRTAAQGQSRH